jgi:O-antigen/teichoic acid export membrane protein
MDVALLGVSSALLWPTSYYSAVLYGLSRQATVGLLTSIIWTLRVGVGLALLVAFGKQPSTYFAWQAVTSMLGVLLLRRSVLRALPDWRSIAGTVRGAIHDLGGSVVSVSAVAAAGMVFSQMDKVIVGRLFSLETFGYYSLAWQLAGAVYLIYGPIYSAFMPAISRAYAAGNEASFKALVADAMVVMGALILPLGAAVSFVSEALLYAWTGSAQTTMQASSFLSFAFFGTAINALIYVPFAAQMAANKTSITLRTVVGSIVVGLPCMLFAASSFAARGVVATWALMSIAQVGVVLYLTVTAILRLPMGKWVWRNFLAIVLPATGAMAAYAAFVPDAVTRSGNAIIVVGALAIAYAITLLSNWRAVSGVVNRLAFRDVRENRAK